MNAETEITPPEPVEDEDGGSRSGRLSVHWLDAGDVMFETSVQLMDDAAADPDRFADAVLRSVLALAALVGPEHSWAVMAKLAVYDGMQP